LKELGAKTVAWLPLIALGFFASTASVSHSAERQLPAAVVQRICAKYEGQPAFVRKDGLVTIDCPYVSRLATFDKESPIELYRRILGAAGNLAGLRASREIPTDVTCGKFVERPVGAERVVECTSDLPGEVVTLRFFANARGELTRFETAATYSKVYRAAMERAISRGSVLRYYDSYVNVMTDLFVEKLRFTASDRDKVTFKDDVVTIVVAVP
jgi:hypothetical protein